jgi:ribose transport system ATP-binding protein
MIEQNKISQPKIILDAKKITKIYPGVIALKDVDLEIYEGEIVSLVGQNGAGKSTLSNIIYGATKANEGNIIFKGQDITEKVTPKVAQNLGISVMFQESVLIPELSIAENIFLGSEISNRLKMVDFKKQYIESEKILNSLELDFDVKMKVKNLNRGMRRLIEIARAVSNKKTSLIIMDEPTAAINKKDKDHLFKVLRKLKQLGISILYISHYLDEIFEIADRVVVFRDGNVVGNLRVDENLKVEKIIGLMTGGIGVGSNKIGKYNDIKNNEVILEVKDLSKTGVFSNVSFNLRKGEVLGIAGLVEDGQKDLVLSIYGSNRIDKGEIYIGRKKIRLTSSLQAIRNGIGFISEDRFGQCLLPNMNVRENMTLQILGKLSRFLGFIDRKEENRIVNKYIEDFGIITSSINTKFMSLSGGNKQKAIVARLLMSSSKILIINEPTHGVDVKARVDIHKKLIEIAQSGLSLILVTSELDELYYLCHRILIMNDGIIKKELISEEVTQNVILEYINGERRS